MAEDQWLVHQQAPRVGRWPPAGDRPDDDPTGPLAYGPAASAAVEIVARQLGADAADFAVVDDQGFARIGQWFDPDLGPVFDTDHLSPCDGPSAVDEAFDSRAPFVCTDLRGFAPHHRLSEELGVRSIVIVPSLASTWESGFVMLLWRREPAQVTDEQLASLGTLADLMVAEHGRTEALRAVSDRERLLSAVLDNSPDSFIRYGADRRIEYANRRTAEMSGIPQEEWIGRSNTELGHGELGERWDRHLEAVFEHGVAAAFEFEIDRTEGHRWYEARLVPVRSPDGTVTQVIATTTDITTRRRAEARLAEAATRDPLTGLANRALLVDELGRALAAGRRSGRRVAALLLDLDHFKYVNDSLGHAVGDELLREAARRICASVREGDLVARHGGDEFVVVMRDVDDAEPTRIAERLVACFRSPITVDSSELVTTASVGIAVSTPTTGCADDLLRDADTAMYAAKSSGRDRASSFDEVLRVEIDERLRLENDLRRALELDQLVVWYQPEIDLATGHLHGVEALLRWQHPSGELVTADRFIDAAEETGLILDIGDWVIRTTFAQAARWHASDAGRHLVVRVNLSALQLTESGLVDAIDLALGESCPDPSLLCVEITETAFLRDTSTVRENLQAIHDRGISLALDDFGTGYASLSYLHRYPVDVIKIDRSFVTELTSNGFDQRLVRGVIALATELAIPVTAEGVEQREQALLLRAMGCSAAQGWLYSKAVPPECIDGLLVAERLPWELP